MHKSNQLHLKLGFYNYEQALDNYSKYKFKWMLTTDPSETASLEYKIKTNYTVIFLYSTNIYFSVLTDY